MTARSTKLARLDAGVYYLRHRYNLTGLPKCAHLALTQSGYTLNGVLSTRKQIETCYRFHHPEA